MPQWIVGNTAVYCHIGTGQKKTDRSHERNPLSKRFVRESCVFSVFV